MRDDHRFIDLHMHSNCSDGACSPEELVRQAAGLGLVAMAIADHDSVSGVQPGLAAAQQAGIELIPAVELSVKFKGWKDVHLLGYGLDWHDPDFLSKLHGFQERRRYRNVEILERINACLASEGRQAIQEQEVLAYARDTIGRPHIARALLEHGYARTVEDAFQRYLIPCNVPKRYWPIDDAISEIRRIGGAAVLAHPTSITADRQQLREIIFELKEMGLDGLEVFNNMAQPDEMEFLRRRAMEAGLIITAGSDYHGIETGLEIGRGRGGIRFNAELLSELKQRITENRRQPEPDQITSEQGAKV